MPFDIKTIESPTHKIKLKVQKINFLKCFIVAFFNVVMQKTASMATVELCPHSVLGAGFSLLVGLSEIHVPRMWVEEDRSGHHVRLLPLPLPLPLPLLICVWVSLSLSLSL